MREGVRRRAVERGFGADADADDHKAQLVHQAVGQDAPQVVLDDGVKDGQHGHGRADPDELFDAGEGARQGIDRGLGAEGSQKDRAGGRGGGVAVDQPGVQQREGALDAEGAEQAPGGRPFQGRRSEVQSAGLLQVQAGADHEQKPRGDLPQQVAVAGGQ